MSEEQSIKKVDLTTVNLNEIKNKLYENLKPSGWGDKLKTFILSDEFDLVLNTLLNEVKNDKRFTPVLKQVFRAFEECPLSDLKVIIIANEPNNNIYVSDGIAFSCSNLGIVEEPLKTIFKALESTVYKDGRIPDPDLKRWSNQGILLLNTSLTTRIHTSGDHIQLWKPFMSFLFDYLLFNHSDAIYVFMGKKSEIWLESIPEHSDRLIIPHPFSALQRDDKKWEHGDLFNTISKLVKTKFNTDLQW